MKKLNLLWIIILIFIVSIMSISAKNQLPLDCLGFTCNNLYRMNEASGTVVVDSMNNTNLTCTNCDGDEWEARTGFGNAVHLDNVNEYLYVADMDETVQGTVCAWFNLDSYTDVADILFASETGGSNWEATTTFEGFFNTATSYIWPYTSASNGEWQHFCETNDGSNNRVYRNGTLVDTHSSSITLIATDRLAIGAYFTGVKPLDGLIDDFVIIGEILNVTSISAIYNFTVAVDTTPPTNSTWNVTSQNLPSGENSSIWNAGGENVINITNNTLSLTVVTDENSNGSCILDHDWNYTTTIANNSNYKFATTETTSHSYLVYDNISVGNHCLYCSFIDADGNEFAGSSSGCLNLTRNDITPPTWDEIPSNRTLEFNQEGLYIEFNATDSESSIDTYFVNETDNFTIDGSTGVLTNTTFLNVYNFYINVSVNDTYNNIVSMIFNVNITDTIAPAFTEYPTNLTIAFNEQGVEIDFNATDDSGIDTWYINETTNFTINSSGYLTNTSFLGVTIFNLLVSVNDTYNNTNQTVFQVNISVIDTTAPTVTILHPVNGTTYNQSSLDLNWTTSDTDLDWCAYSLDGVTNNSYNPIAIELTDNVYFNYTMVNQSMVGAIKYHVSNWSNVQEVYCYNQSHGDLKSCAVSGDTCFGTLIFIEEGFNCTLLTRVDSLPVTLYTSYFNVSEKTWFNWTFDTANMVDTLMQRISNWSNVQDVFCYNSGVLQSCSRDGINCFGTLFNIERNARCYIDTVSNSSFDLNEYNYSLTSNITLNFLTEGNHNITINCNDTAGNMGQSNYTYFRIYSLSLYLDGLNSDRKYEYGTTVNISETTETIATICFDILDNTSKYLNVSCGVNSTYLFNINKTIIVLFNDTSLLKNLTNTTNSTIIIIDNRTDLVELNFNITGYSNGTYPENITIDIGGDGTIDAMIHGRLVGDNYEIDDFIYNDVYYSAYNLTYTSRGNKIIYLNITTAGNRSRNGTLNFSINAFDIDVGNEFNYDENFSKEQGSNFTINYTNSSGINTPFIFDDMYSNNSYNKYTWGEFYDGTSDISNSGINLSASIGTLIIQSSAGTEAYSKFSTSSPDFDLREINQISFRLTKSLGCRKPQEGAAAPYASLFIYGETNEQSVVYFVDTHFCRYPDASSSAWNRNYTLYWSGEDILTLNYSGNLVSNSIAGLTGRLRLVLRTSVSKASGQYSYASATFSLDDLNISGIGLNRTTGAYEGLNNWTSETLFEASNNIIRAKFITTELTQDYTDIVSTTEISYWLSNDNGST